ncbi:hypothetical protein C8J57DRAFT_1319890 [Mycena rebaudengoi]|nr:hypothetical protein C8J57DRAFT_1319890 [Mycena rebaudengoi]
MAELKQVVVLGAGVVGLTTAVRIQETGAYQVTIVAEVLPSDPKCIKYTSHWAGAQHVTEGLDDRQRKMDRETFETMWEMSAPGGLAEGCFLRIHETQYHAEPVAAQLFQWMPDYKVLPSSTLPPGIEEGISFTTVTIDCPVYLNYLLSRFLARGGSIVRGAAQHISEVIEGGAGIFSTRKNVSAPAAVVVCVGLGARTLGGVEDEDVHPIRGQTVVLRAPWIRTGRGITAKDAPTTYIIPRRSGDVILGGIRVPNDWYPIPRRETTQNILERGLAFCPELAPPEIRAQREPTLEDLQSIVVEEGCGLRPGRKGGIRLEVEWFERGDQKVPVVYNYGHGSAGYQSSWGSATLALQLLEGSLAD